MLVVIEKNKLIKIPPTYLLFTLISGSKGTYFVYLFFLFIFKLVGVINVFFFFIYRHIPSVIWAQRADKLYVTICIDDCKNAVVNFENDKLTFRFVSVIALRLKINHFSY